MFIPFDGTLSPAQTVARSQLEAQLPLGSVFVLRGDSGLGRSTVLRILHQEKGGRLITMGDFLEALAERNPWAIEETFNRLLLDALQHHDIVWVDDLSLLTNVVGGCGPWPRNGLLEIPISTAAAVTEATGKKLVLVHSWGTSAISSQAFTADIDDFGVADYEYFARRSLGSDVAARLDFGKIHRYAGGLDAHQLLRACAVLRSQADLDTEKFIEYLKSQFLTSNIDLEEVQAVALSDLRGIDDVVQALEAHVALPLENDNLATRYRLNPKRGVLLAGPPGTGKTTVGRALAHRLKGKFFRLDGTFIAGTDNFYHQVRYLFHSAMQNPPSVLFIDDADVLFENNQEPSLYRYLLTLLDGLESKTAGQVCVVMTAMDVAGLPPALVRSGRIELWLEMRLPDETARRCILADHLRGLPAPFDGVQLSEIVDDTDGFTGADLKRLVNEAKVLFAADEANGNPQRPMPAYFLQAAESVRINRRHYASAQKRSKRPRRNGQAGRRATAIVGSE